MQRLQHTMRRAIVPALLIALLIIPTVNPTAAAPRQQEESSSVTLRIAMPAPNNLDPTQLSRFDPHTRDLAENLFVGLARIDPTTNTVERVLAKDWSVSDDGLTWTIELRDDMYWVRYDNASGTVEPVRQIVAGDLVYTIQRACDPLRPSPVTANLMAIKGCLTVSNAFPEIINDLFIAREIGVRADGPNTLEIDLLFPVSYFPTLLSMPELRPLPRETLQQTQELNQGQPVMTSGPFALQAWESNGMTLVRNPHWPDSFTGNVEQVAVSFTSDASTTLNQIGDQQIDFARLDTGQFATVQSTYRNLLKSAPSDPAIMLGYSLDRAVVELPDARRALSLALDRDALARTFFSGDLLPAEQFTLPGVTAAPEPDYALYDPQEARRAFDLAGFPGCNNIPEPLILLVPNDAPVWVELGNAIVQQWVDTLGCSPALFEVKAISRTLLIELAHANYDPEQVTRSHMWLFTWNADYPDAHGWLNDALHCTYGYIRNGRQCGQTDNVLDQAGLTADTTARSDFYAEVEQLFFSPADGTYPVAPLFVSQAAWLQQPWLNNVNGGSPARFDLWTISADE